MLRAGHLRESITLRQPVVSKNSSGEDITTFVSERTLFAQYVAITKAETEMYVAAQKVGVDMARFIIRRRDDIPASWRLLWRGVEYNILSPPRPLDRVRTEIICQRGLP